MRGYVLCMLCTYLPLQALRGCMQHCMHTSAGEEKEHIFDHTTTYSNKESASYKLIIVKRKDVDALPADEDAKALDDMYKKIGGDDNDAITKKYFVFATAMQGGW